MRISIPISPEELALLSAGELAEVPGGLHTLTFGIFDVALCQMIERQLDFKGFHYFPLMLEGELLGTVIICMIGQVNPQHPHLITAFINQAVIALQRLRVEAALERERAYLATAVDMLPIPIGFRTADGGVIRRNLAMQKLLDRFKVECELEWTCLDPSTRIPIPYRNRPIFRALQGKVIAGCEMVFTADVGKELPVIVYAAPIRSEGKIVAAVCAVEDISALKEADRVKDEFLATLSHEMQTPLTSILGWSNLALERGDPALLQQAMVVVRRNARRQEVMVRELLDLSRLSYRKFTLLQEPLDVRDQLQQAIENILQEVERHELSLECELPPEPLPMLADAARLQQCFGNILQNSIKFTPAGGSIRGLMSAKRALGDSPIQR